MGTSWRKETLTIAGHAVGVRLLEGDSGAPTIIALHGFTGSGRDFQPLIEATGASGFSWILPDLMGHGESDAPENIDPYLLVRALQLIDACRALVPPGSPAQLLGYSMGGRLALQYLYRAAPLPTIIIGSSPGIGDAEARKERRESDRQWIELLNQSVETFCEKWEAQPLIHPQTQLQEPLRTEIAQRRRASSATGLANSLRALGTGTLPALWKTLPAMPPVRCLFGERDTKFAAIARKMVAQNPQFTPISIPDAGHAAHLENPGAVAEYL